MKGTRIKLFYTEAQWEVIREKIGGVDLHSFINRRICGLPRLSAECPPCIMIIGGKRVEFQHHMSGETLAILKNLAAELQVDPSVVVSGLIIDPILFGE